MLANRLRHRVSFQKKFTAVDDKGFKNVTWVDASANGVVLNNVPAEVLTGPGREPIAANAKQAETALRVNLRWFPGLQPDWRLVWQGVAYDIFSIETDVTNRREYRLKCTGGLTDGQ